MKEKKQRSVLFWSISVIKTVSSNNNMLEGNNLARCENFQKAYSTSYGLNRWTDCTLALGGIQTRRSKAMNSKSEMGSLSLSCTKHTTIVIATIALMGYRTCYVTKPNLKEKYYLNIIITCLLNKRKTVSKFCFKRYKCF